MKTKSAAFTLIELLVVIAVIAVLMGILMPALSAARKQGAAIVCQSNLRQMVMAFNLYAQDHDQKTMTFLHGQNSYWFHQIAPYLSAKDFKNDPDAHQEQMKVAYCPTAHKRRDAAAFGTAIHAWRFEQAEGSYGLNLWLLSANSIYPEFEQANYFRKFSEAGAAVPVMGDSVWVGAWPDDEDLMPADLTGEIGYPGYAHPPGQHMQMGRFCVDRHKSAINVGFADTHVERVGLNDLWQKKWHKNFRPTAEIETP